MNSLRHGQSWDVGGPTVFHSEWWVRAHWGRAFEVLKVDDNFSAETVSHGFILLRKREIAISTADLEAIESSDTREITSLKHNIVQLHSEEWHLRRALEKAMQDYEQERAARYHVEQALDHTSQRLAAVLESLEHSSRELSRALEERRRSQESNTS